MLLYEPKDRFVAQTAHLVCTVLGPLARFVKLAKRDGAQEGIHARGHVVSHFCFVRAPVGATTVRARRNKCSARLTTASVPRNSRAVAVLQHSTQQPKTFFAPIAVVDNVSLRGSAGSMIGNDFECEDAFCVAVFSATAFAGLCCQCVRVVINFAHWKPV